MTASAAKLEGRWLDKFAQVGVDQTKSRINSAAKARRRAQFVRQFTEHRHSLPERLDPYVKHLHCGPEDVLLGECRFRGSQLTRSCQPRGGMNVGENLVPGRGHMTRELAKPGRRSAVIRPFIKLPMTLALALVLFGSVLAEPAFAQTRSSSYCDSYARQNGGTGGALAGAARGAVGGAVIGGIVNGKKGARRAAKVGGVGGALSGGARQNSRYQELYSRCINGRPL